MRKNQKIHQHLMYNHMRLKGLRQHLANDHRRFRQNLTRRPQTLHDHRLFRQNIVCVRKHLKGLGQNQYLKLQAKHWKNII